MIKFNLSKIPLFHNDRGDKFKNKMSDGVI